MALHEVRGARRVGILARCEHLAPARHAAHPGDPHEAGDLVPADVVAGTLCRLPELVGAIDLAVRHEEGEEHLDHHGVT